MSLNTEQQPDNSDVSVMQAFVDKYSEPPEADEAPSGKATPPPVQAEAEVQHESDVGDAEADFDYDTLERLGLVPEEQPASGDGDGDGATGEGSNVDLSMFAKTLGIEASDLSMQNGELMVRTKVDGETATVPFAELRKGYQLQKHFTRQQEQFLAERQNWEQAKQQQEQQLMQQASLAQQVLEQEERQLNTQYTRDWKALRDEDPAEYAAQVAEYNQRLQEIKRRKGELEQTVYQRQQEQQQQYQQFMQQRVQQEMQQFVEKTGWSKPETFQENTKRLRSYLVDKVGFTPEEVDTAADHRSLLVAEKARKYDELMGKVATAKKRVSDAPSMPSGRAARQPTGKRSQAAQAQNRLKQTGSVDDAAAVINSLGII